MKKLLTLVTIFVAAMSVFTSCKDDDKDYSADADRLFMPMFRTTTNTATSTTPYYCWIASEVDKNIETYLVQKGQKVSDHVNDMRLFWYTVDGAAGYELKGKKQGTSWEIDENPQLLDTVLVGGDINTFLHEDLEYGTGYLYAIRALVDVNDLNNPKNSKWYGYGDGSHQSDQSRDDNRGQKLAGALNTGERYEVPAVFWAENIMRTADGKCSMDVCFLPEVEDGYETKYKDFIAAGAEVADGKWMFDEIRVVPSADNIQLAEHIYKVTEADMAAGRVHIEGLESNAAYIVSGQNNKIERYFDRQYNSTMLRMPGEKGEPIIIKANTAEEAKRDTLLQNMGNMKGNTYGVEDLVATRIDTILTNYMSDNTIAEGQVFYLEGGQTYYTSSTVEITKGLTLATNPADLAAGKGRATVLQGIGYNDEKHLDPKQNNWGLCRNARSGAENGVSLAIQPIIFEDINFHPYAWNTYYDQKATNGNKDLKISANYFMNMYSQGLSFVLQELRVSRCTMSGHVRGFIRFQGPNRQIIEKMTVEDCVFYDEGGYDTNGRGYSWFAGPGNNAKSNFYKNFTFKNNTIIDCSRHALVTEAKNLGWPMGTKWNINVSNNTFVNFAPRSNNKGHGLIFEVNYAPAGSTITCKNNLFVFAGNPNDGGREYWQKGMNMQVVDMHYDFADNYSTVVPAYGSFNASNDPNGTTLIDGMFGQTAFSNSTSGVGYNGGMLNVGGMDETKIKFGDNLNGNEPDAVGYQLTAEELFKNPAPMGKVDAKESFEKDAYRHADINNFYYNQTDRVKNHPIYQKGIGDPRWRTGASWDGGKGVTVKSGDKKFTK